MTIYKDTLEPIRLKQLPEPLRTFAYNMFSCSHVDPDVKGVSPLPDDDPLIYFDIAASSWEHFNEMLTDYITDKLQNREAAQ